ncbi:MAG: hypothetical protein KGH74_05220 [Candidatus Micrarchaeota archaeon]|nr:hypothetical protein [Candidatus Micrarchaeota archaeon]
MAKRQVAWVKERWFDLRNGYASYFSIVLAFVNFILIISVKFPGFDILLLAVLVGGSVAAAATGVGYLHRHNQMETDQNALFRQSTLQAKVWRIALFGTEAEREEIRRMLLDIEGA